MGKRGWWTHFSSQRFVLDPANSRLPRNAAKTWNFVAALLAPFVVVTGTTHVQCCMFFVVVSAYSRSLPWRRVLLRVFEHILQNPLENRLVFIRGFGDDSLNLGCNSLERVIFVLLQAAWDFLRFFVTNVRIAPWNHNLTFFDAFQYKVLQLHHSCGTLLLKMVYFLPCARERTQDFRGFFKRNFE